MKMREFKRVVIGRDKLSPRDRKDLVESIDHLIALGYQHEGHRREPSGLMVASFVRDVEATTDELIDELLHDPGK